MKTAPTTAWWWLTRGNSWKLKCCSKIVVYLVAVEKHSSIHTLMSQDSHPEISHHPIMSQDSHPKYHIIRIMSQDLHPKYHIIRIMSQDSHPKYHIIRLCHKLSSFPFPNSKESRMLWPESCCRKSLQPLPLHSSKVCTGSLFIPELTSKLPQSHTFTIPQLPCFYAPPL